MKHITLLLLFAITSCGTPSEEIPTETNRRESANIDVNNADTAIYVRSQSIAQDDSSPVEGESSKIEDGDLEDTEALVKNETTQSQIGEVTSNDGVNNSEAIGADTDIAEDSGSEQANDDASADPPVMIIGAFLVSCMETNGMTQCIAMMCCHPGNLTTLQSFPI